MSISVVTIHLFIITIIISYYLVRTAYALSSSNSNQSLRQQIIHGATIKLITNDKQDTAVSSNLVQSQVVQQQSHRAPPSTPPSEDIVVVEQQQYTYYIRHGRRTEINEIVNTIMNIFHPNCQSTSYVSYIRRYKYNQLQMLFDIIDKCGDNRVGIFVACAIPPAVMVNEPSSSLTMSLSSASSTITNTIMQQERQEQIVGFCSVDGRANDPSTKLEYLSPSLLAGGVTPHPYLSDLGVVASHRKHGIGRELVSACEQWTYECGHHDKLYLKVEKKNVNAIRFYKSLGYVQTKLPWEGEYRSRSSNNDIEGSHQWDTTLLFEKSLTIVHQKQQQEGCSSKAATSKRRISWIKDRIWRPLNERVNRLL
jgi:ribosomal protein S18 acetylase RimI-like enzyme